MIVLVLRSNGEVKRVEVNAPSYFEAVLDPLRWDAAADMSAPVHYERVEYRDSKHVVRDMTPVWTVDGKPPQNAPWPVFRGAGLVCARVSLSALAVSLSRRSARELAWAAALPRLDKHVSRDALLECLRVESEGCDELMDRYVVTAAVYEPVGAAVAA